MLRLGVLNVLNTLPVYYQLLQDQGPLDYQPVLGKVTELNHKLNQGEIDLSAVSSFEVARNQDLYYILPDLSVGSDGPVRSIYLFSQVPWEELDGKRVLLTAFSLTSVHLVQFLLQDRGVIYLSEAQGPAQAELLIADDAIRRFYEKRDPYVYDLGQLWKERTGLPFVFALWVVRREVFAADPKGVMALYQRLLQSRNQAPQNLKAMAQGHYAGVFPDPDSCEAYLANLHYELGPRFQAGFLLFQEKMLALGKLSKLSEPVFLPFAEG